MLLAQWDGSKIS